jgi:hypothetical protein
MSSFKIFRQTILTFSALLVAITAYGQKGPGGVSVETADPLTGSECRAIESTCGLWLDASTITASSDGSDLMTWTDVSLSSDCDDAIANNASTPPIYRNDPAFTINGFPTVTFEEGRFLRIASSEDLNTEQISFTRTILFAFRTSEDVTTKQILYEEGGTVRGFNVSIHNGRIIIGSYDWAGNDNDNQPINDQDTPPWGYTYTMETIEPNKTYILTSKMYANAPIVVAANSNYYVKGWLNGVAFTNPDFPPPLTNDPKFSPPTPGFVMYQGKGDPNDNNNPTSWGANNGIGTLARHPDPCGLGAINSDMVDKDGVRNNDTGQNSFSGLLAEMIVYRGVVAADEITDVKRIIVENYLASKYLADLTGGRKYPYAFLYGKDLIGLGRNTGSGPVHEESQGRNPFKISNTSIPTSADAYFFTGHNGQPIGWTNEGVPNNSNNIERLERIWRVSRTSSFAGSVTLDINLNDSDAPNIDPPAGYTGSKLVLLVDETSANIPNFSLPSTRVLEIAESPSTPGLYQLPNYGFPDGKFFTLAWLKPEVNFRNLESFSVESDLPTVFQTANIEVQLNYDPIVPSSVSIDYSFIPITAQIVTTWPPTVPGDDFYYDSNTSNLTSQTLNFTTDQIETVTLRIINDDALEALFTENFSIELSNPTGGLLLGPNISHIHTIYDNDPPPEISFPSAQIQPVWQENQGTGFMTVNISDEVNATFRIVIDDNSGVILTPNARPSSNGLDPDDYDFIENQLYSITSGTTLDIPITILDDFIDEGTEIIKARIKPVSGAAAPDNPAGLTFEFSIIDDDVPSSTFANASQAGFESNGSPSLLVTLGDQSDPSRVISSRELTLNYTMADGSTTPAVYNTDYAGAQTGQILFPPFADEAFIGPFTVNNDGLTEPPENIDFTLIDGDTDGDPIVLGAIPSLIYTIYDYTPFEFQGVGGVGRARDNVIWIDASQEPLAPNIFELDNKAPNFPNPNQSIRIRRDGSSSSGANNMASAIGSRSALDFNGLPNPIGSGNTNDATTYQIDNNARTNTAGTVDKLSYFFVVRPESIPTSQASLTGSPDNSHARLIYEQGGGVRGVSIYLYDRRFYFHAWNNANDDGDANDSSPDNQSPWGHDGNRANSIYASSHLLSTSAQDYVISCHYDNSNVDEPLRIFVNGRKGTFSVPSSVASTVGRLWGHSGAVGLGGVVGGTLFHFSNGSPSDRKCAFDGKIAEYVSFFEPEMNEARRIIIENSLAAKYGISLDDDDSGNTTPFIFNTATPNALVFNTQVAGIGQSAEGVGHSQAQGPNANLKVRNASFSSATDPSYILWGHNGGTLTNTWPFSDPFNVLPAAINERSGQVWKVFSTDASASAEFIINFSSSDNAIDLLSTNSLKLLVHTNDADPDDFSSAMVYPGTMQSGYEAVFDNVPVTNGMYIALGNTSDYFNTPLPIELISFDAKLKGTFVDLNWQTATEINNDYFVVERASEDLDWEPILTVTGAGNSNSILTYSDKDRDPLTGLSYYRLKQVDFDGGYAYSDPVSIFNNQIEDREEVFMHPNPSAMGSVFLRLPFVTRDFQTEVKLFDLNGRMIVSERFDADADIFEFKFGNVTPGMYLVYIESVAITETKKLIIE